MIIFNKDYLDMFLGVVRKYMQMRGNLSQKDLGEKIGVGVSTMSRLINHKTRDVDEQIVAKIVAYLEIPLHEIIDFVSESSTDGFKKLVAYHKDIFRHQKYNEELTASPEGVQTANKLQNETEEAPKISSNISSIPNLKTSAQLKVGGKATSMPFGETGGQAEDLASNLKSLNIRDKLEQLSPRQKAYLTDFLNCDGESKDLLVDVGNSLFRYFRQKGIEI